MKWQGRTPAGDTELSAQATRNEEDLQFRDAFKTVQPTRDTFTSAVSMLGCSVAGPAALIP